MHILVVDDEAMLVESIRIGLSSKGHHVLAASSAHQALDLLAHSRQRVDLVLTDYLMPGMNGLELLIELQGRYPSLPVVIMTGYAENNRIRESLRRHSMGLIKKPFSLKQLVEALERACGRPASQTPDNTEPGSDASPS